MSIERLKNAALVFFLFIVLAVIFRSCFRASEAGTFFGALAGTPLFVHVFNRLVPRRPTLGSYDNLRQCRGGTRRAEKTLVTETDDING
jgi:hypothetical protein